MRLRELLDLVIAWIVITVAFSASAIWERLYVLVPIYATATLLGFVGHELAHRFVGRKFGAYTEFRAWYLGLAIALVTGIATRGSFIVAAPGAVYIYSTWLTPYEEALIALAGPTVNLVIGLICLALRAALPYGYAWLFASIVGSVNATLAFFNMIPVPPLDGYKVFRTSIVRWAIVFGISLATFIAYAAGVS